MKVTTMEGKDRRLIELLADGATTQEVARKMGYSEGTVRVYLHNVYRRLGVRNRTEAVIWFLNRARPPEPVAAPPVPASAHVPAEESFGAAALRDGLFTALGVMESFLGPYGRVWEVGVKMKGESPDEKAQSRRAHARLLWRALLQGDFAYGKRLHDELAGQALAYEAPSEAVLLATLLVIGGYSSIADRYVAQLARRAKGTPGISAREAAFLRALSDAVEHGDSAALGAIYRLAAEGVGGSTLRQLAMVALFYVYQARKDAERASGTADAIWAEAEAMRGQLEAMGVRPLDRDAAVPAPAKGLTRRSPAEKEREKAAAR